MNLVGRLRKTKKLRMLILSAGGPQSGIQGIYIAVEGDAWESLAHAVLPYPDSVEQIMETVTLTPAAALEMGKIAWLDRKLSYLFLECAKAVLSHAHKSIRNPHCAVMNRCLLYSGFVDDTQQARCWDVSLGDGQLLASFLGVPVVTDFPRHGILAGTAGHLPLFPGNVKIAKQVEPVSMYLNIGIIAHITIVDNQAMTTVLDSDIGPGTCLIDRAAREAGCPDGFDRDGSFAAKGTVDNACVTELASQDWFQRPSPKHAFLQDVMASYQSPLIAALSPYDKIATLTALTARTAFEFFKREYRHAVAPEVIRVSGGGANNLTLLDYLSTYFDPVKVQSVEESGIPAALRIPLALGLSVHEYIAGHPGPWKNGANPEIEGIGRWVFP
jgi:anhydro-N-acetylmuramic acid kinase